jgi:hypothetical protein
MIMIGKYLWFAVKVNLLIFGLTIVIGLLSAIVMFPFTALLSSLLTPLILAVIIPLWLVILLVIPLYFAFKWLYRKAAKEEKLQLKETIIYSVGLMVVINVLFEYMATIKTEQTEYLLYLIFSVVLTTAVFYFAGRPYEPKH